MQLDLSQQRINRLWYALPYAERVRLEERCTLRSRRRRVAAWGQVMLVLGRTLGVASDRVKITRERHGKPVVAWPKTELRFTLSHSDGLAVLAVATGGHDIGVDIERIRRVPGWEDTAARHLSQGERHELDRLCVCQRHQAFLQTWTRKEALLKARGSGIVEPLDRFDTTTNSVSLGTPCDPCSGREYLIRDLTPNPAYVGAVACSEGDPQTVWRWEVPK